MAVPNRKTKAAVASTATPRATDGPQAWQWAVAAAVVLVVLFAVYGPALDGPFVFDDYNLPFGHPDADRMPLQSWLGVRPLLMVTFFWNYQLAGTNPFPYHATNLVLHFLTGLLVFVILRTLLAEQGEDERRRTVLAGFGAGLLLFHPIQTEAVAYIASRSDILSTLFAMLAVAVFVVRTKDGLGFLDSAAVLALFAAAVACKEQAAALPLVLILIDYFTFHPFTLEGIRRNWRLHAPVLIGGIVGVAYIFKTLRLSGGTAGFSVAGVRWYEYLFTQFQVIWHYVRLVVLPFGQNVDPDFPIARSLLEPFSAVGLAGLLGVTAAAWIFRKQYPLAALGWLVFLASIAPTSSLVPILDPVAERRVYFPFFGLALIAVEGARRLPKPSAVLTMAAVLIACMGLTWSRAEVWGSGLALWKDAVAKSPNKGRPHFQLASVYYNAQEFELANAEFARTAQLQAPDLRLMLDWALALDGLGKSDEALAKLREGIAKEHHPSAHAFATAGMIEAKRGRYDEALQELAAAQRIEPGFAMTYVYRGHIHRARQQWAEAAAQYRLALANDPRLQIAIDGLGAAEAQLRPAR